MRAYVNICINEMTLHDTTHRVHTHSLTFHVNHLFNIKSIHLARIQNLMNKNNTQTKNTLHTIRSLSMNEWDNKKKSDLGKKIAAKRVKVNVTSVCVCVRAVF